MDERAVSKYRVLNPGTGMQDKSPYPASEGTVETALTTTAPAGSGTVLSEADADAQVVAMWLHGRSRHTQRAYASDVRRFTAFIGRPLQQVTLQDVQVFADSLVGLADNSRARTLAAVKSLLTFAHELGYVPFNVAAPVRLPKAKNTLAERILDEADVQRMIGLEPQHRNEVLLRLLYAGGLRVSELCDLKARDLQPREQGGQVTIYGKGSKTRVVLLPPGVWKILSGLQASPDPDAPVFRSEKGGHLDPSQVFRIVRAAANRAGIHTAVSPHWLRHAHASAALEHGAPIHLVQATLGHASVATTGRYLHARPGDSSARYVAA
jgi:integrase/recombinase XerD